MKRIVLFLNIFILLELPIPAYTQPYGWIWLYADSARSSYCKYIDAGNLFDLWVWCRPSENGQIGVEFAIEYPESGIFYGPFIANDNLVSEAIGDLINGIQITYDECQYDWNWPLHQQILIMISDPLIFKVAAHSGIPFPRLFNCEEGNPAEQCWMCDFYVNTCPP